MERKKFLKKGLLGMSTIVALPSLMNSCKKDDGPTTPDPDNPDALCTNTPMEIEGPFPNKTPAELVQQNIIGDRTGVALRINIKVLNTKNDCKALAGALVDIWQCDSKGNYSEYDEQIDGDFTNQNFLRGRQATDAEGNASFISIYPGWYPGRAPHLHIDIRNSSGQMLLISQIAFPENISNAVYATSGYNGNFDTPNANDLSFEDSLDQNIATVSGNITDGYTLEKTIWVTE